MESFHVAWSDESDLKLAWSSETVLFKLFPFGPPWRHSFSISVGFCRTASPTAAIEWSTENIYSECQP